MTGHATSIYFYKIIGAHQCPTFSWFSHKFNLRVWLYSSTQDSTHYSYHWKILQRFLGGWTKVWLSTTITWIFLRERTVVLRSLNSKWTRRPHTEASERGFWSTPDPIYKVYSRFIQKRGIRAKSTKFGNINKYKYTYVRLSI